MYIINCFFTEKDKTNSQLATLNLLVPCLTFGVHLNHQNNNESNPLIEVKNDITLTIEL